MSEEQEEFYRKEKLESIWIRSVEAQLGGFEDVRDIMDISDTILSGFKLRFEDIKGGIQ